MKLIDLIPTTDGCDVPCCGCDVYLLSDEANLEPLNDKQYIILCDECLGDLDAMTDNNMRKFKLRICE